MDTNAPDCDVLALLQADGVAVGALGDGPLEDCAPYRRGGICLDNDPVSFRRTGEVVLPGDVHLLLVCAGLDPDGVARLRGVHGRLDSCVAESLALTRGVGVIDVEDAALLLERGRRE
jgi:hypothetical protein